MATSLMQEPATQQLASEIGQQPQRNNAQQLRQQRTQQVPQVMMGQQNDELDSSDEEDHFPPSQAFPGASDASRRQQAAANNPASKAN